MYDMLKSAHDGVRWIVVILGVWVLLKTLIGWLRSQNYGKLDQQLWLGLINITGIQFLLGITLIIWQIRLQGIRSAALRLPLEHAVTNFIAIAVLMYASRFRKLDNDVLQHRNKFIAVLIAAVLVYLAVDRLDGWSFA